jgi:hypothetical protein
MNVFPCESEIEEKDAPLAKSNATRMMLPAVVLDVKATASELALEAIPALACTATIVACAEAAVSKPTASIGARSIKLRICVLFTRIFLS